jgi:hypothetical protein
MQYLSTPPREQNYYSFEITSKAAAVDPSHGEVARFVSSSVLYLLYNISADDSQTLQFQKQIISILAYTTNNVTSTVILTSLLYVSRYVEYIKLSYGPIPAGCEVKIWLTALMLADASLNDAAYSTKSWAQVSELPVQECIRMRRVFLEVLNYDLHVNPAQYREWINTLQTISVHVSCLIYYKNTGYVNSAAPILSSQSLLKQPRITLSPRYTLSSSYIHIPSLTLPTVSQIEIARLSPQSLYNQGVVQQQQQQQQRSEVQIQNRLSW